MGLSKHHKTGLNNKGSVLVTLIITMVVLAALGAAMVSLTSTSMFGQVGANSSARAYFLAESGYRYAESRYLSVIDRDKELEALHDAAAFTLLNNAGQFDLKIYPYYFKLIESPPFGTKALKTRVFGGFPPGVTIGKPGWLKIGPKSGSIYKYDDVSVSDKNVTFTMHDAITAYFPADPVNPYKSSDVLYAAEIKDPQTVTKGGDLQVRDRTSGMPLRNGTLMIKNRPYSYKENDVANRKFIGIEDPADPNMPDFTVLDQDKIVLQKFVKLHSTGFFGQGSVEGAASRELVYHVPLPSATEERKEFKETFADLTNWKTSTLGTFALDIGRSALRVTGTGSLGGTLTGSLIKFDSSATNIDLAAAHLYGNPYFLSYDAQVKVGFSPTPTPEGGFDPSPIPKYFAAGLSFRLDNDNNSYGLSFLRGDNTDTTILDNLDNNIVPLDKKTLIVLWQGTGSGNTRKWLAYKKDLALFFKDNMESGVNGWTVTGTDVNVKWQQSTYKANSPIKSWRYGRNVFPWNYDTGARNSGTLESPSINLSQATAATLTFWTWIKTEPGLTYDQKHVEISTNGGVSWSPLLQISDNNWTGYKTIDLSAYRGQSIKIRFRFDTIDALSNNYEGWHIDDVRIAGDTVASINEATLAVRVKEAASVTFTNGNYGGGTTPIENLDTVVGQISGARGVVSGTPIVSSGSWALGNAAGTLLLKNTTGTFSAGEQIKTIGSAAAATVSGYRSRDNFIRAYYGTSSGYGTPDNNPLNDEKKAYPRDSVNWPPDEEADWSSANDYFTLVQWDVIRSDLGDNVVKINSINEPDAIIRSNTLTSPTSGPLVQPELGLHTFGRGSTNVYFDDFAVQADVGISGNTGFVRTIQE